MPFHPNDIVRVQIHIGVVAATRKTRHTAVTGKLEVVLAQQVAVTGIAHGGCIHHLVSNDLRFIISEKAHLPTWEIEVTQVFHTDDPWATRQRPYPKPLDAHAGRIYWLQEG
ncbi:hypothetical protein DESC_370160 [Desulfosarcina cetonica]|uniref:hypothetical protein n=1 Tax=Desulfosarcina cetonica TaxID=90730 RepID=UPI001BC51539|nr:hypothetical protein [Desulfosarcina cetonica]VTR65791.1 hypothetical protein DESC_370160 [Desulfosarcina cetonica]